MNKRGHEGEILRQLKKEDGRNIEEEQSDTREELWRLRIEDENTKVCVLKVGRNLTMLMKKASYQSS
ncbi:hypothetical protein PIB30_082765, partial [Stylosanthes scabra]|nr:hypothetical protein [Stylosanthes scabra]